jgi:uncharacterized protein with NRDE domain
MCLCLFAIDQHDEFPFILLANRDEFRKRPSEKAGFWKDHPQILAGRDLQQMGTWLGVNKSGKIAFLTNYRDPKYFNRLGPSRGALVAEFLKEEHESRSYLESIENVDDYNGFNLVTGTVNDLHYFSNVENEIKPIEAGIHGLSNAFLNTSWPKVDEGKAQLLAALKSNNLENRELFSILRDDHIADSNQLPNTGVGEELEKMLSPRFINSVEYGTVCSTVIKVNRRGVIHFEERSFDTAGNEAGIAQFELQIS